MNLGATLLSYAAGQAAGCKSLLPFSNRIVEELPCAGLVLLDIRVGAFRYRRGRKANGKSRILVALNRIALEPRGP